MTDRRPPLEPLTYDRPMSIRRPRVDRAEADLTVTLTECVEQLLSQTLPALDPTDPRLCAQERSNA